MQLETPAAEGDDAIAQIGPLEIRLADREALVAGVRADLTVREFQVLQVLAERPDRVVTRDTIYGQVWGGRMPFRDRSVDVHVRRIRLKLASVAPDWRFLHTHFGVGYRLAPEPVVGDAA